MNIIEHRIRNSSLDAVCVPSFFGGTEYENSLPKILAAAVVVVAVIIIEYS